MDEMQIDVDDGMMDRGLGGHDELVIEEGVTEWLGEEPSIGHEETVGDVYNRERNIELLEMEDVLDVGQAAVGGPELSLASLLSKSLDFEGNEHVILCFSKKGQIQLAVEGFLYNVENHYSQSYECFWRCVNHSCQAKLRSTPGFAELSYINSNHHPTCQSDEMQLRLRIGIFDLRLYAEFTDEPLEVLHRNALFEFSAKAGPDADHLFPPFEAIVDNLAHHRDEKPYRRAFEQQHLRQRLAMDNTLSGKKTKPLPLATCIMCGAQMRSADMSSQDILIAHLQSAHDKPDLTISSYTFDDAASFEQWIRHVQETPGDSKDCRLKRYGVFDECLYYLCHSDSRQMLKKRHDSPEDMHASCTAFVRVRDFRNARDRTYHVTVDYNFDHWIHSNVGFEETLYPDYFMETLKERRKKTQEVLQDTKLQRISRVASMNATSAVISTRLVNTGVPTIQQQANRRTLNPMTAYQFSTNAGSSDPADRSTMVHMLPSGETTALGDKFTMGERDERLTATIARLGPMSHMKPELNTITQKSNFRDSVIYNHVLQLEQQCYHLIRRMQLCSSVHTAKKCLGEFLKISQDLAGDSGLTGREAEKKPIGIGGKRGFDEMEGGMSTSRGSAPHISQGPRNARVVKSSSARISDVGPMCDLSKDEGVEQQMAGPSTVSSAAPSAVPKLEQRQIRAFVKKDENGRLVLVRQTVMRRPVNDNELVSINQQQQHPQLDPTPGTSAATA
ncbi:unnamed protein product, partial [Mesorhabditis spiculigera]